MAQKFTPQEDDYLRNNYLTMTTNQMAKVIDRSKFGIRNRLRLLGLKIPYELAMERSVNSLFKPGHKAFNKGKKQTDYMSPEAIEAVKVTQFKKGNKPHNTLTDGVITRRTDKRGIVYQFIRVDGVFLPLHRHLWQEANNQIIKEGFNVIFIDGNPANCVIENLKLVSNAELQLMNSIHNLPEDLKEILNLTRSLNNKIKKIQKQHGKKQD